MASKSRSYQFYTAPGVSARQVAAMIADQGTRAAEVYGEEISKRRRIGWGVVLVFIQVDRLTKPRNRRRTP